MSKLSESTQEWDFSESVAKRTTEDCPTVTTISVQLAKPEMNEETEDANDSSSCGDPMTRTVGPADVKASSHMVNLVPLGEHEMGSVYREKGYGTSLSPATGGGALGNHTTTAGTAPFPTKQSSSQSRTRSTASSRSIAGLSERSCQHLQLRLELDDSANSNPSQQASLMASTTQTPANYMNLNHHLERVDVIEDVLLDDVAFSARASLDPLSYPDSPGKKGNSGEDDPLLAGSHSSSGDGSDCSSVTSNPLGRGITAAVMPMIWITPKGNNRRVAVKILNRTSPDSVSALAKDLAIKSAFEEVLAEEGDVDDDEFFFSLPIGSSNIMPLLASYVSGNEVYCVMERFSGSFALSPRSIPEPILALCAHEMFAGLQFLHEALGVIHRDIKPSNIMYHVDGRVRLIDFGHSTFAAAIPSTGDGSKSVKEGSESFVGSLSFMARERLLGLPYTYNSDVWSMGISLMTMFLGDHPFRALLGEAFDSSHEQKYWCMMEMLNEENGPLWFDTKIYPLLRSFNASPVFVDFLRHVCAIDPTERLSAEQARIHSWITVQLGMLRHSLAASEELSKYFRSL